MSCELCPPKSLTDKFADPSDFYAELEDYLVSFSNRTPLEVVAAFALKFEKWTEAGNMILTAYDQFLAILGDADKRALLEKLGVDDAA